MLPETMPTESVRIAGAAIGVLVILYWTFERLRGEDHDPVLRMSSSSDSGSASFFVSGVMAVVVIAAIVAVLVLGLGGAGPIVANPGAVLVFLALLVFAHWVLEKEESET
ncbi:hypothetical protein [Halosimplex sp. TS25]|uniref:hypothetical protein n=1 Tax=Halosimplex rarum TaxID=3396619 RepID=UPI0039E9F278